MLKICIRDLENRYNTVTQLELLKFESIPSVDRSPNTKLLSESCYCKYLVYGELFFYIQSYLL